MMQPMPAFFRHLVSGTILTISVAALAGCSGKGELVVDEGVGITAVRSVCPAVGIADYTGDITLFQPPESRDAGAIDISAALTDVRSHCDEKPGTRRVAHASPLVNSDVTFHVQARRADAAGARDVVLPYFVTVVRGDTTVVAKRIGTVTLHFADGQLRAEAIGQGAAAIERNAATLDRGVRDRITQKRNAGESDAAVDPLSDPAVRAAVKRASFEVLVGFQLDDSQLAYNATR